MTPYFRSIIIILFALFNRTLLADTTDAERYVNAQGIEIIHNRGGAKAAEDALKKSISKQDVNIKTMKTTNSEYSQKKNDEASQDSRMKIDVSKQKNRDNERLAILQQELMSEMTAFQLKKKIVNTPNIRAKINSEDFEKLQDSLTKHEQNIRLLNVEIKRTSITL